MPKQAREYVPVRLSPGGVTAIRELAATETDGNLSEMIRRLLGEALAHRARPAAGRRAG